jgi:Fe-S-cluster-containing hydrogenase component 2/bacterioferritin-associated ferredoxin
MDGVKYTGVLNAEELNKVIPAEERLKKGPVAVIECVQEIPCNPCEKACPFGAISVGADITALPIIDRDRCTGCGLCISKCPGLAIFVVDASGEGKTAKVSMPYEYLPLPKKGEIVTGNDREGHGICKATVEKIDTGRQREGTTVVTLSVPLPHVHDVRSFRPLGDESVLLCRCSEVTEEEVRQAVREGARTVAAVKTRTRAGMGLCQGRTCRRLIARLIAEETGQQPSDLLPPTSRPPVRTVALSALAGGEDDE